jgi:hypothetical protein
VCCVFGLIGFNLVYWSWRFGLVCPVRGCFGGAVVDLFWAERVERYGLGEFFGSFHFGYAQGQDDGKNGEGRQQQGNRKQQWQIPTG